jgi:acyl-CoA dehydrogenase
MRSAFSMTEPETAGSDPTLLRSSAELEGDHWVINGHKWYTSNGMIADFLIAMVVTEPDAGAYQRASMIIVPRDTPGLELVRNVSTMGGDEHWGYGHAEVIYDNVRVPKENLLGKRGGGFEIAQIRLGPGRIHHCMRWLGQARRAFDILCERSLQRQAFGGPLAGKQTVQNWIADSAAEMQAARLMTLHAAWVMDQRGASAAREEISMIKFFGAKVLHDVIDRAIQVCGSLGYSSDLPLESMYRHARAARLYDGADEVHRQTLARLTLKDYQAPEGIYPTDHIPTRRAAAQRKFAQLLEAQTANL